MLQSIRAERKRGLHVERERNRLKTSFNSCLIGVNRVV